MYTFFKNLHKISNIFTTLYLITYLSTSNSNYREFFKNFVPLFFYVLGISLVSKTTPDIYPYHCNYKHKIFIRVSQARYAP